jgi:hypothetical protein
MVWENRVPASLRSRTETRGSSRREFDLEWVDLVSLVAPTVLWRVLKSRTPDLARTLGGEQYPLAEPRNPLNALEPIQG